MRIYIASSWRNQHAVEMLTDLLEHDGHEVLSFIRNANEEPVSSEEIKDFKSWVWSDRGAASFIYDTGSAMSADLVIYIGPSGCDAWAEVGAAYAKGRPILGLWAKGEPVGLMRRMVSIWLTDYAGLLARVDELSGIREQT